MAECLALVNEFKPDVIHVHGSERFYGLLRARNCVKIPTLLSIQGLVSVIERYIPGTLRMRERWQTLSALEIATRRGWLWEKRSFRSASAREIEILRGVDGIMGRTLWDHAHGSALSRGVKYFQGDELLRPEFYSGTWASDKCDRYSLLFTNAGSTKRDAHVLLEALRLLRNRYPAALLRLAGAGVFRGAYGKYLKRLARDLNCSGAIEELGYLSAQELTRELLRSHVFCIASAIENSPNSLCEAMTVGTPSVSSYVGGIPSLGADGRELLFFPAGDAYLLAARISEIFESDSLANSLSSSCRARAKERHSSARVVGQVMGAYRALLSERTVRVSQR
jgi:glycosyltransferase involved in cell wall biosynthesis